MHFRPLRFSLLSVSFAALTIFFSGAASVHAQNVPAAQNHPALPPGLQNPTQPEVQPPLDQDRDPIPSPDIAEPENAGSKGPAEDNQLTRQKNGIYTMHEDVDEVLLDCTVIDDRGRPVLDLNRNDFHVSEDGVPQSTTSFVHQDVPVAMGILIDSSGSMLDKRGAVDSAANKLLALSNPRDFGFVVNFNEKAYLDQGLTVDRVALRRGIEHFDARGPTALYDAVAASADELSHHAKQRKQVLLIVTDGADNASRLGLQQAIRRVQSLGGPVVYTIGLLYDTDPKEAEKARNDLDALATETGGIAYFPNSLSQVDEIASDVARDIRNQYTVGYHSTRPASLGGYRTVHVEANAPGYKHLIVRTRRGYYAKPGQRNTMSNVSGQKASGASPQQ
jgi:Ca-activated chloride channel homolog